jgi:hypothetical protein
VIRAALPLLFAAALVSAEDDAGFQPALFEVSAGYGGGLAMQSGTSALAGGVRIAYEHLVIEADRVEFAMVAVPGLRGTAPSFLDLQPATGGSVVIDTTGTSLRRFPVRMRVAPAAAGLTPAGRDGDRLRWRLTLEEPGVFAADIRAADGTWLHHLITARRVEALVEAPIIAGALGGPVLRELRLHGRPPGEGQPRERAAVRRYRAPVADPATPVATDLTYAAESVELVLACDEAGNALGISGGLDFSMRGLNDPRLPGLAPGAPRPPRPSATR